MRCPACDRENVAGAELCEACGADLLEHGVPRAGEGIQAHLLLDPLSALRPDPGVRLSPSSSAAEAIRLMKQSRHGSVLVIENGRLAGLFTERDVLLKIAGRGLDLERTPLARIMNVEPPTLREDDPLGYAIHLMAVRGIRHVPVMPSSGAGAPVGVVSIRGVLGYLTRQVL